MAGLELPRVLLHSKSPRARNLLPAVSVGIAIAAVAVGVGQLASTAMAPKSNVLHPEDVVVTSMGQAPLTGRENTDAVSTGDEFIVWGGTNGSNKFFADGAAYDYASKKWHRIAAAPIQGRSRAAAAWVDNRMIVWGGTGLRRGPQGLSDGAAYDPATDSWHLIKAAPGPGRVDASAIAYGGRMYIAGGVTPAGARRSGEIMEYDPVADSWRTVASVGPVFAAGATSSGLVTAEVDPSSGTVTSHLITLGGTHNSVSAIDSDGIRGELSAMTLVPDRTIPLLVTTNRNEITTVYALRRFSDRFAWSATARTTSLKFRAVDDIDDDLQGAMKSYRSGAVLAAGSRGVWDLAGSNGRAALGERDVLRYSVCGAGSAYASTPYGIVLWGGQACRPNGSAVTRDGILIALNRSSPGSR